MKRPAVFPLLAVDQADSMAQGLEQRPFPYFLGLVLLGLATLWGALVSVAWWGAKGQLAMARGRADELRAERDAERKEADRVRAEHIKDLVTLARAADGLTKAREELMEKKKRRETAP